MTCSELLTPSVSECPSLLGLKFPSRESLGGFLEKKLEHSERLETQSLNSSCLSSRATERDDDGGMMLNSPPMP